MKQQIALEAGKATPPVTVTLLAWFNAIPMDKLVGLATLIYVMLQSGYLVWQWRQKAKSGAVPK